MYNTALAKQYFTVNYYLNNIRVNIADEYTSFFLHRLL